MAAKKKRTSAPRVDSVNTATEPPEMTVNEVAEAYPEQWVLMRVTRENEYRAPWRGHILAVSPERKRISEALGREPKPSSLPPDEPRPLYYVFQAYPHFYGGEALQALLAQWREADGVNGQTAEG
jgi:hypothetical protein